MKKAVRWDVLAILLLVFVAAFFRFHRLHQLPIGLWRDEAANGLEALRVLDGDLDIFYGTREPMFIYVVALSIGALGRNPLAIRSVAALAGTATTPITYLLVKEIFRRTDRRVHVVAFLTSFWLATSYWHVNFSRLGFRGVLLSLFASLAFYLFWRGWNRLDAPAARSSWTLLWFGLSGLCLALTFYTYTPSRFLSLLLLPFLVQAVRKARRGTASALVALAVLALCFLVAFAPLGVHFLQHPQALFVRSGVSIFGAAQEKPLPGLLVENSLRQLGMFGILADPNTRHNPAGRPAFDLFTLVCFVLGMAASLRRGRRLPYLFCLLWLAVMLLPAILTYPELPHSLRAIGALPIAYVFPALGVEGLWRLLEARAWSRRLRPAFSVLVAGSLVLTALLTYRDYFSPQVEEIELIKAFDPRFVEIASRMNEQSAAHPDAVWIVPVGPKNEQRMACFVIDFLYQGQAPHRYVRVDAATLAEDLNEACRGSKRALLLQRTGDWPAQVWYDLHADWRGVIPFLLDKHGERLETRHFEHFDVLVYQVPEDVVFSFPSDMEPMDLDFGQGVTITGGAYGLGAPRSCGAWLALRWQMDAVPSADYAVQVVVMDEDGHSVVAVDKLLLSAHLQPTSQWQVGQQEVDYYTLDGLPEPRGDGYSLYVSVYAADVEAGPTFPPPALGEKRGLVVGSISPDGDVLSWVRGVGEGDTP
jgi:4-amino-4-deoxy-L-arabinose transferase-like glycosyltransferase